MRLTGHLVATGLTNLFYVCMACAVNAGLDAIVTRNPKDFAGSPVPILTPAEILALRAKAPDA